MRPISQPNEKQPSAAQPVAALVDPEGAERLRAMGVQPSELGTGIAWQVASSRGAVRDRLLRDASIRIVIVDADTETDPLLRDLSRNTAQFAERPWLHFIALTASVTPELLRQLRQFKSWSVLTTPCDAGEIREALREATARSAEQHRLAMLSAAIRAEAEDILTRTRNIVGALRDCEVPAALGNLVRLADRMTDTDGAPQTRRIEASPSTAGHAAPLHGLSPDDSGRHWTRSLIGLCSARQHFFPDGLFSDPAWDMLLDLTHARLSQKRISVSSLCIAARVPATTALRRIGDLVNEGLVTRIRDENDGRRVFVELTEDGFSRMMAYIENVRGALPDERQGMLKKA
ncbi:winged helix DNA-binding protein [Parvibaculum sp.]|uniref:winged helix DNA-binding protein n=1 Tax=Parvibaculum sp. TaxID=2024848 RepID=UPI0026266353|nr:winged helix DNA-binding protein [Parvibaculum sp.]